MKYIWGAQRRQSIFPILAFILCLIPGLLYGQEFRATVTGHVTDPSGASVPNAVVQARNVATKPIGAAPEGADLAELAAWTLVGNVLLNLDETLMKR